MMDPTEELRRANDKIAQLESELRQYEAAKELGDRLRGGIAQDAEALARARAAEEARRVDRPATTAEALGHLAQGYAESRPTGSAQRRRDAQERAAGEA